LSKFLIKGPAKLSGEIEVMGAKNAAMKLIAACVLIPEKVILENMPDILDIQVIIDILTQNGAQITRDGHRLTIDTAGLSDSNPDPQLVQKMRGSIVLIGPYLSRFGKISIPKPGGDAIGARPIVDHLNGFKQLGVNVSENNGIFSLEQNELLGTDIDLCPSVTATENLMMAQVLAKGKTTIRNVAQEPQIEDLANFLNAAGAKITGAGTSTLEIEGVDKLHGTTYKVMPDPFEACTFISLAVATKSPLKISHCNPDQLHPFIDEMKNIGVNFEVGNDYIAVKNCQNLKSARIETGFYPEFSTDMLPQTALVLTQAEGASEINETLYEGRLGYLKELEKMGAKIEILNAHKAKIFGPTPLSGADIVSLDIRAGATVILAGLVAQGETSITNAEIIDRGYEKIEERLQKIGAKIQRVE